MLFCWVMDWAWGLYALFADHDGIGYWRFRGIAGKEYMYAFASGPRYDWTKQ